MKGGGAATPEPLPDPLCLTMTLPEPLPDPLCHAMTTANTPSRYKAPSTVKPEKENVGNNKILSYK